MFCKRIYFDFFFLDFDFFNKQIRRIAFAEDGSYFVTVGNRHVKFWYLISTSSVWNFSV
jgi:hypothetical protein